MSDAKWSDLKTRVISAAVLLAVFLVALYIGPRAILILAFVAVIAMHWELARMLGLSSRKLFVVCAVAALGWLPLIVQPEIINASVFLAGVAGVLPIFIGSAMIKANRLIYMGYGVLMTIGMLSFWFIALNFEIIGVVILALIVIISDVGGYFAGRTFGGPKFWPAVSPKKTWSGTIAGWIGAAILGLILSSTYGMPAWIVPLAVLVAFGAQLGDIAESWVKRKTGIKDSSNLIPGHGGVLDRFDGIIGGAAVVGVLALVSVL